MTGTLSLKQLTLDVWLLEQLRNAPAPGLTLEQLQKRWQQNRNHEGVLGRTTMTRHRKMIEDFFGIIINSPDKKHYSIANPEDLRLDTLANELLASVQEYIFLDEFRDLGSAIQPQQIWQGLEYLRPIGEALRYHNKLQVRYQKFTDTEPYDCILHPYCLKADKGRWYLLAHKENSEHEVQTFALDRTLSLVVTADTFLPDKSIDPETYFRDCFGIWCDFVHFPVQNVYIRCTNQVAHYLRTLPLHHSQHEIIDPYDDPMPIVNKADNLRRIFRFRISPTPDFISELQKWGKEVEIHLEFG